MDILRELNCLLRSLTRRLQVLVDDERHSALEREAARTGRSVGAVVRAALDDHLGLERPHARGAGARLLCAPPSPVGNPEELADELASLSTRFPA